MSHGPAGALFGRTIARAGTPDHDEDWFVIARNEDDAQLFHENAEGYEEDAASAEFVCVLPLTEQRSNRCRAFCRPSAPCWRFRRPSTLCRRCCRPSSTATPRPLAVKQALTLQIAEQTARVDREYCLALGMTEDRANASEVLLKPLLRSGVHDVFHGDQFCVALPGCLLRHRRKLPGLHDNPDRESRMSPRSQGTPVISLTQ